MAQVTCVTRAKLGEQWTDSVQLGERGLPPVRELNLPVKLVTSTKARVLLRLVRALGLGWLGLLGWLDMVQCTPCSAQGQQHWSRRCFVFCGQQRH